MRVNDEGGFYSVWDEDDLGDEQLLGAFREVKDDFFRFHPARSAVLTCKQLRKLAEEVSRLNVGGDE